MGEGLLTDCVTDDASLCLAVNGADKDCFKGKTGLRRAASIYAEQKFDHVEETKSITRKDDGVCQKSMETNTIRFRGNKIQSSDISIVMYDDTKNCKRRLERQKEE